LRRFRRPAPLLFLTLVLMALGGGLLYAPTQIDTNAYRIPRVLHWLGSEQWHWIHTYDPRLNSTACGFEWLCAPLILFTRTDRLLFLINWVSYLMLPGLIFSVFVRLGVLRRVAWWWMWFLSSAWVFALQAGSTSNDAFGAIYALAAVDLALRGRETKSISDLWLSMIAAALLVNVKQTNLPLALPWLIAIFPVWKMIRARPVGTALVATVAVLVSFVPITVANLVYCGDWMGFSPSAPGLQNPLWINSKFQGSPFWAVLGNAFDLTVQNLAPPYFPLAERWNEGVQHFVRTPLGAHFVSFDRFGLLARFASELNVGVGPGIFLFTLLSMAMALKFRDGRTLGGATAGQPLQILLRLAPWAGLLVLMMMTASFAIVRYTAPYYPLLFPAVLAGAGHSNLVRRKWWQKCGLLLMASTAALLVVSPERPLFPVRAILTSLPQKYASTHAASSVQRIYATESLLHAGERNPFVKDLPPEESPIGYTSNGGLFEPGLWLPFGSRKVELVRVEDTREILLGRGVRYVVVEEALLALSGETIEQWLGRYHAELIQEKIVQPQAFQLPIHLYLVQLR
jgi:hypothetical protein